MGEAKRRGTRDDRVKQSLDKHVPVPIEEIRAEFGLPDTAEFLGYVLHLPKSDEFLAASSSNSVMTSWGWAKSPERAHRYAEFSEARKDAEEYGKNGVIVALLFDTGSQLFVAWS